MKNKSKKNLPSVLDQKRISQVVNEIGLPIEDPNFYPKAFGVVAKILKKTISTQTSLIEKMCAEEYDHLSRHLDASEVQDSCAVRNVLFTRKLAEVIITEEGELDQSALKEIIEHLQKHLYSLGPGRQHDAKRQELILRVLCTLNTNKQLVKDLISISKPESHRHAIRIIRDTLQIPEKTPVTDAHARRAALSAWLCFLRQSVGSCFGTAPSILVHAEQFGLFLRDIKEILNTGRIKRVFGGVEYSVPLSQSWGSGDLKKRFLMRRTLDDTSVKLWWSPGLISSLKAVGLIEEEATLKQKRDLLKSWIEKVLEKWKEPGEAVVISCEDILRYILLQHHNVTEDEVSEYLNRNMSMIHSGMIMQAQAKSHDRSKGSSVAHFLSDVEEARRAFLVLADNALLKAWEFTIASFAETKANFTRWNLYSSLGVVPEEKGGIGECLYQVIQRQLEIANAEVEKYQGEYESVYGQLKFSEGRLKRSETEQEARWLKSEYQSRVNEFHSLEEMRDRAHNKARRIANFFQALIDRYYTLFPNYFQEVYDADMHLAAGQYDDSPAGFRLMYKHGRTNTSQWTFIRTPNDYVENLANFFVSTEFELKSDPDFEGLEQELSEAVTRVVSHVRTQEFLETSFDRMAKAHGKPPIKNPLDNLEKIEKKPWAYTSGGNVDSLLSGYFAREEKPTVVERWVENETELLLFIIDTFRTFPYKEMENFLKIPDKSLLMHSPTHVFLVKPALDWLKKGWETNAYTYTWVRDQYIGPHQQFLYALKLDEEMMQWIIEHIAREKIPPDFRPRFKEVFRYFPRKMGPKEFREHVSNSISTDRGLPLHFYFKPADIDSFLYTHLPLFSSYELKERVFNVLSSIPSIDPTALQAMKQAYEQCIPTIKGKEIMSAKGLESVCKSLLLVCLQKTSLPCNYHREIREAMRKHKYALPKTFIFADTNWEKGMFGFVVNPGTEELELWHVDDLGAEGFPMFTWKQWLDGSRRDIPWGIYTRSYEYTSPYG